MIILGWSIYNHGNPGQKRKRNNEDINGKYFQVEKNMGAGVAGDFNMEGGKGRGMFKEGWEEMGEGVGRRWEGKGE